MHPRAQTALILRALASALALAGIILMVVLTGGDALPIGLAWAAGSLVVAGLWAVLRKRAERILLALILIVACVVLGWEGGLFMLPAALVLLGEALSGHRAAPPRRVGSGLL